MKGNEDGISKKNNNLVTFLITLLLRKFFLWTAGGTFVLMKNLTKMNFCALCTKFGPFFENEKKWPPQFFRKM